MLPLYVYHIPLTHMSYSETFITEWCNKQNYTQCHDITGIYPLSMHMFDIRSQLSINASYEDQSVTFTPGWELLN